MNIEIVIRCRKCKEKLATIKDLPIEQGSYHIDIEPRCERCQMVIDEKRRSLDIILKTAINNIAKDNFEAKPKEGNPLKMKIQKEEE